MSRGLIDPENTGWRKAIGCLAAVFIRPVGGAFGDAICAPYQAKTGRSCILPARFIEGTGGPWDWDDFVSIPIADPRLEAIRKRASKFPDVGPGELEALLSEAEVLASVG
jgi:hypothetical protein